MVVPSEKGCLDYHHVETASKFNPWIQVRLIPTETDHRQTGAENVNTKKSLLVALLALTATILVPVNLAQVHGVMTPGLTVSKFYTDSGLNPLPLRVGLPSVIAIVLPSGVLSSTSPSQVLAWVNMTNTSGSAMESLKLNETLPVDWVVLIAGGVHVFYANGTSLASETDITQLSTITLSTGNPENILLSIPSFTATGIGHPLMPGQSILLQSKLTYGLIGTAQSLASYPRNYTDTAGGAAWSQANFTATESSGVGSAFFIVLAKQSPGLVVSKFYTDTSLNPLPTDRFGNPKVDVVLAGGVVKRTNPGAIIAWVNITNTSGSSVESLKVNETLPVDWVVAPAQGKGAIQVFYANTTSLATNLKITVPSTISLVTGNPEIVLLAIPSLDGTLIGHPLLSGQSILLGVKLGYGLTMTSQSASSYPRNYTDTASAAVWVGALFTGTEFSGTGTAFFVADAKVVG